MALSPKGKQIFNVVVNAVIAILGILVGVNLPL